MNNQRRNAIDNTTGCAGIPQKERFREIIAHTSLLTIKFTHKNDRVACNMRPYHFYNNYFNNYSLLQSSLDIRT